MNSKVFYYLLIGVLVIAATIGLVAFYYAAFGNLSGLLPPVIQKLIPFQPAQPAAQAPAPTGPQMHLVVDANGRLVLSWQNIPAGVRDIHIYRSREGQPRWSLWKTISISDLQNGLIQLQTSYSQSLLSYIYYFEGIGDDGTITWTSSSTSIVGGGQNPLPSLTPSTPISNNGQPSPSQPSGNSGTQTPSSPTSPTPTQPTNTITYYTPQGDISGSTPITTEPFWVTEVNKKIQIGWTKLNASSTKVVIYRAPSESGPWTILFQQNNPVTDQPYSIFILDDAVSQTAFYKLASFSAAGPTLDTFGPVAFHPSGS